MKAIFTYKGLMTFCHHNKTELKTTWQDNKPIKSWHKNHMTGSLEGTEACPNSEATFVFDLTQQSHDMNRKHITMIWLIYFKIKAWNKTENRCDSIVHLNWRPIYTLYFLLSVHAVIIAEKRCSGTVVSRTDRASAEMHEVILRVIKPNGCILHFGNVKGKCKIAYDPLKYLLKIYHHMKQ